MTISKVRNKFRINSLIQFSKMFADVMNGPNCTLALCLKPLTNTQYVACGSTATVLELPFHNFFFHINIFKLLCTNCSSKVPVPFIGDLNFGFRKYLICFLQCIWLNHKLCFCLFRVVAEFRTNDS